MSKLLHKELGLCTQAVTWGLLAAALLTMVPGYPILVGTFLICLGIFHSFQYANESNDILYSVLLPVRKSDIVKAKYVKVLLFEGIGFAIMAILTVLRMTLFGAAAPYTANAMMNATPFFLACALVIFAAFNVIFVGGYFKTAWRIGMPFLYPKDMMLMMNPLLSFSVATSSEIYADNWAAFMSEVSMTKSDASRKLCNIFFSLRIPLRTLPPSASGCALLVSLYLRASTFSLASK